MRLFLLLSTSLLYYFKTAQPLVVLAPVEFGLMGCEVAAKELEKLELIPIVGFFFGR